MIRRTVVIAVVAVLGAMALFDFAFHGERVIADFLETLPSGSLWEGRHIAVGAPRAEGSGTLVEDVAEVNALVLISDRGDVSVTGVSGDQIRVDYDLTVYAETPALAEEYLEDLSVVAVEEEGSLRLRVRAPEVRPPGILEVEVDYWVRAPRHLALVAVTREGSAEVSGLTPKTTLRPQEEIKGLWTTAYSSSMPTLHVLVSVHGGTLRVSDVDGEMLAIIRGQSALLEDIHGPLWVQSVGADVRLSQITGDLWAKVLFEDLWLVDITGEVTVEAEMADVRAEGIDGDLDFRVLDGDVSVWGLRSGAQLEVWSGDIEVFLPSGPQGFQLSAAAEGGDVEVRALPLEVHSRQDEEWVSGTLGDGRHSVILRTLMGGDIILRGDGGFVVEAVGD
mgnify:CR=1 FL=1